MIKLIYIVIMFWSSYAMCADMSLQQDTPIYKFYLPIFGENGFKACELIGLNAQLSNTGIISIKHLSIKSFDGSEDCNLQITIESPNANISTADNVVYSAGIMFLTGNRFTCVCSDWQFYPKFKKIVANKEVKVLFEQNIVNFLRK